eukprot:957679-Rhodomonas_salina.1
MSGADRCSHRGQVMVSFFQMLSSFMYTFSVGELGPAALFQTLSCFPCLNFGCVVSAEWSPSMLSIMEIAGLFSFNILAFPGPTVPDIIEGKPQAGADIVWGTDAVMAQTNKISHEGRLVIYTMLPIVVVGMLTAPGGIALLLGGHSMDEKRKRRIIQTMVRPVQVQRPLRAALSTRSSGSDDLALSP